MTRTTTISWTEHTWNPTVGCEAVSTGCDGCYARVLHEMRHKAFHEGKPKIAPQYAEPFERVQLMPDRLDWPLSLRKPSRIFVNSVSDLFHKDVPVEFLDEVFARMALARRHTFQALTKRPARGKKYLNDPATPGRVLEAMRRVVDVEGRRQQRPALRLALKQAIETFVWPLPNYWHGTSVENQSAAETRIPQLLATDAAVRWLSCEPLVGAVDLSPWVFAWTEESKTRTALAESVEHWQRSIDWIVVGGESGDGARPMHPGWVRLLRMAAKGTGTAFHFKQYGAYRPVVQIHADDQEEQLDAADPDRLVCVDYDGRVWVNNAQRCDGQPPAGSWYMEYVGKRDVGREFDGLLWDEYPTSAKVRA